jgi:hypothetical protein
MDLPNKHSSKRSTSRIAIIILASVGGAIVLALLGIFLFAPRKDMALRWVLESAATETVRNLSVNQVNYYASFDNIGFARDLASLGPGADGKCAQGATTAHACEIDAMLGAAACTGTNWCVKDGYKFNIQGICADGKCTDYVISATPVDARNGSRNFCSSSDNPIRSETAPPRSAPFSLQECHALPAMQ